MDGCHLQRYELVSSNRSQDFFPFRKSIYIRFQFAFGLAAVGLLLMAVITTVSSLSILKTYEVSLENTRIEMTPLGHLQDGLRKVDHLVLSYVIQDDEFSRSRYDTAIRFVDAELNQFGQIWMELGPDESSGSNASIDKAIQAWDKTKSGLGELFDHKPGSPQMVEILRRAHLDIDALYGLITELQHLVVQEMMARLAAAQTVGMEAIFAVVATIIVSLGFLIGMASLVGRSMLQPIAELREAARKLGKKDFSHRVRLRNNTDELGQLGKSINAASATLQKLYAELERRSTYDGLTGVLNRAAFDERLMTLLKDADRHNRPLSLLMVDIDFFKRVNDTLGHQAGDQVLHSVAEILAEMTRPGDIVARYGGEEFAIILPETGEVSALTMAERLRVAVEGARVEYGDGGNVSLTVSIGCASQLPNTATPGAVVKTADSALYDAKNSGRNRVSSAPVQSLAGETSPQLGAA